MEEEMCTFHRETKTCNLVIIILVINVSSYLNVLMLCETYDYEWGCDNVICGYESLRFQVTGLPGFDILVPEEQRPRKTDSDFSRSNHQEMEKLRTHVFLLALLVSFTLVYSMPYPGGGHHEHTHFILHIPELIHKHHHTHVKKIHIKHHDEGGDDGHEHIEDW